MGDNRHPAIEQFNRLYSKDRKKALAILREALVQEISEILPEMNEIFTPDKQIAFRRKMEEIEEELTCEKP